MAIKGLKVKDNLADPTGGSAYTAMFVTIEQAAMGFNFDGSVAVEIIVRNNRSVTQYDSAKQKVKGFNTRYDIKLTKAEWAGGKVNDIIYNNLKTAMEKDYSAIEAVNA